MYVYIFFSTKSATSNYFCIKLCENHFLSMTHILLIVDSFIAFYKNFLN